MDNTKKLFRYFGCNLDKAMTIRNLCLKIKIPYMTLNRIIKKLEKEKLVITKKQGNAIICYLNKNNNLTKHHLILADESFKTNFLEKKPLIKKIYKVIKEYSSKKFSAILFGSYAKGKEQKYSDIDIAFISNSKKIIKNITNEFKTIEQIHDIEINTMVFSEKQFKEMLKSKQENVGKQILENHIIFQNPELFWNLIFEAII